jgi:uncharacterized membrane protein YphA (DoxX/SURF4 family)
LDVAATKDHWSEYKDRVAAQLAFDEKQMKEANDLLTLYVKRMETYRSDNSSEIREYFLELERYQNARKEDTRQIPFQRERLEAKEAELRGKVTPWLKDIATLGDNFQADLHRIATPAQLSRGVVAIPDRAKPAADNIVKYVVIGSGILLILGLFTRLAAVAAIGFLLSVMAAQPPWVSGADTTYFYYQMVEVFALGVLFVFAAGRYAGLDFVIHGLYARTQSSKTSHA